jgi:hypothetical protein
MRFAPNPYAIDKPEPMLSIMTDTTALCAGTEAQS